ncbi:MAG: hypothetical protein ACREFO_12080 [Acetobacteraceae bacterium]
MSLRYRMELNQEERARLVTIPSGGKHAARKLKPVQIPLAGDAGKTDESIATNVPVGLSTVHGTKHCFVPGNPEGALGEPGPAVSASLPADGRVSLNGHVALPHEETAPSKPGIEHLATSPSRPFPLVDALPGT